MISRPVGQEGHCFLVVDKLIMKDCNKIVCCIIDKKYHSIIGNVAQHLEKYSKLSQEI